MGLIDLKTDLTSLRYGKDTLGGGYSGQPYIQTPIPDSFNDLGAREDFVLRGGINAVKDSVVDIKRLGKMFIDTKSPNGLLFIAKQQVLSRTAVRTQTSGRTLNEGIYSPLNTLAQAGVIAFGTHLNKQGLNPFAQTGAYATGVNNEYLYNAKVTPFQLSKNNRLVNLYLPSLDPKTLKTPTPDGKGVTLNDGENVMTYTGGPNSILGVGNTNIRYVSPINRTGYNNYQANNPDLKNYFYGKNQQRSVDISNKQVGGLKIEPAKPWTWSGPKIVTPYTTYDLGNFLPSFDVNKPQSGSLSQVPNNAKTWTSNQSNPDSVKYYKTFYNSGNKGPINNTGISGKYFRLTSGSFSELYNNEGVLAGGYYNFNVYEPATEGNTWPKNSPLINAQNTYTYNQEDIIQTGDNSGGISSPKIQDFRATLREKASSNPQKGFENAKYAGQLAKSRNYNTQNFENRVKIGDPGKRGAYDYFDYEKGVLIKGTSTSRYGNIGGTPAGLDKINSLPIYRSQTVDTSLPVNDFVKFRIAVIDNDNPNFKTFMHFRAFLGPITDSYNASWNSFQYLGRGENFYTYGGFTRTISLSWTVAAQSKQELIPMYKKLNYLASTLAPDYSPKGYMRGNLVQLTIGGYLYEQPGFITGLSYEMGEDSPWEIGIGTTNKEDKTVKELTQIIKVSGFNFTPIQSFVPRKQQLTFANNNTTTGSVSDDTGFVQSYDNQRFIALNNGINNNYDN
jgi:hypothetical protein